jgi:hypothetical protein
MPERGGYLHWVYDARIPGQIYAFHESAARIAAFFQRSDDLRARNSRIAAVYTGLVEQGAFVEKTDGPVKT